MTNNEAIGILAIVVETAKGRCFVTDEAISDAYAMAIKALEAQELSNNSPKLDKENGDLQPTCNQLATDTISRQAAIDVLEKIPVYKFKKTDGLLDTLVSIGQVYMALKQLPPAQPGRKKGNWIPQDFNTHSGKTSTAVYFFPKCSVCGNSADYTNYCPACGADMRG